MSMHKKPLKTIEEAGLIAHGMGRDIGRPSQAADIFRHGMAWALMSRDDQIKSIERELDHGMPFDEKLRDRYCELLETLKRDDNSEYVIYAIVQESSKTVSSMPEDEWKRLKSQDIPIGFRLTKFKEID